MAIQATASPIGLQPGTDLDGFHIVERIGGGAFSEVYRAVAGDGRDVVLKCPHEVMLGDAGAFDRFRREMKISESLDHPGIQRSRDHHGNRSQLYMVLEYVDGSTLRQVIHDHRRLDVEHAVDYARQIASAMAYAHSHGVFHRDLKPENVLVTPEGRTVITDFGIALMEGAKRLTFRWMTAEMGTPDYMAPEQVQGKRGDDRTDVYAIGVILFEMLAGRVPWKGRESMVTMNLKLSGPPADLERVARDVPVQLAAIVRRCLRRNPDERYQTAGALLHDLSRWQSVDPAAYAFGDELPLKPQSEKGLLLLMAGISVAFVVFAAIAAVLYHLLWR